MSREAATVDQEGVVDASVGLGCEEGRRGGRREEEDKRQKRVEKTIR